MVSSGESSLVSARLRMRSSRAASCSVSFAHASGRRVWTRAVFPTIVRGRLRRS